jgi:hypothetical protein
VKIPVSELKAGNKVKGTTIAELGAGNRPLDMIVYTKGDKHFIMMANSRRGVMKLSADNLDTYKPITAHTEITGVPYETIADLKDVQQLDKFDDSNALVLSARPARWISAPYRCRDPLRMVSDFRSLCHAWRCPATARHLHRRKRDAYFQAALSARARSARACGLPVQRVWI